MPGFKPHLRHLASKIVGTPGADTVGTRRL
jgi:hypothetical protein